MQALRDPIHGAIDLEGWAVDLLDSREMQRLRRIRQLGTAYLVYPGANHTRFEHSLGAHKLARDATVFFRLPDENSLALQAAALLHDVGHGPMSHTFEEADPRVGRHEEFGADLVRWSGLADRLRANGIDPRRVADLLLARGDHASLVSGDIDADRMDYLVRDAYYTGLRVSVDPVRILQTMTLQDGELLIRQEGITAVEALLLARFLMYPAVYFHHTCRAAESMILAGVRLLLADGAKPDELRLLDDARLLAALEAAGDLPRRLAQGIQERRLYKRAFEGTQADVDADAGLKTLLDVPERRVAFQRELAQDAGLAEGEVLVDSPRLPMGREVEARVLLKSGDVVPLREASTLVGTLLKAQADHWRFWVFAPRDAIEPARRAFERARTATRTNVAQKR